MREHRAFALIAVLSCACGGRTEETLAALPNEAGPDSAGDHGSSSDAARVVEPPAGPLEGCNAAVDHGPISARECVGEIAACEVGAAACHFAPLEVTLRNPVVACGAYCGEMAVGVRDGCVSDLIVVTALQGDGVRTTTLLARCIEDQILGRRWACASDDGWYRLYVGSCNTR